MTRYFEQTCTRFYPLNLVKAWARAEENLGLKNSIFISINGKVIQIIDSDEGEKFHDILKRRLDLDYFNYVCKKFLEGIDKKDIIQMFECLAIFDEIDNYPEIANSEILEMLEKIRKRTEATVYSLGNKEELKSYILFKNEIYSLK